MSDETTMPEATMTTEIPTATNEGTVTVTVTDPDTGEETTTTTTTTTPTSTTTPTTPAAPKRQANGKAMPTTAAERLYRDSSPDWLVHKLAEALDAAVEFAQKADPSFQPDPEAVKALMVSYRDGLSLVWSDVEPKLKALRDACAGVKERMSERDKAARQVAALRAKLAALEATLAPPTTTPTTPTTE